MVVSIRTSGDVRRLIQRAKTASSVLRSPGHRVSRDGERRAIAELLDALVTIAERRLDPEHEPEPDQHHGGEDLITDLFEGAA